MQIRITRNRSRTRLVVKIVASSGQANILQPEDTEEEQRPGMEAEALGANPSTEEMH